MQKLNKFRDNKFLVRATACKVKVKIEVDKEKIFPINFRRWHLTNQFAVYFHTVGVETEKCR